MERLEYSDGSSNKFWQYQINEHELYIQWGKIGTNGQSQTKVYADCDKAQAAADKLIKEKITKGYQKVEGEVTISKESQPILQKNQESTIKTDDDLPETPLPTFENKHSKKPLEVYVEEVYTRIRFAVLNSTVSDHENDRERYPPPSQEYKDLLQSPIYDKDQCFRSLLNIPTEFYIFQDSYKTWKEINTDLFYFFFATGGATILADYLLIYLRKKSYHYELERLLPTLSKEQFNLLHSILKEKIEQDDIEIKIYFTTLFNDKELAQKIMPILHEAKLADFSYLLHVAALCDLKTLDNLVNDLKRKDKNLGGYFYTSGRLGLAASRYFDLRFNYDPRQYQLDDIAKTNTPETALFFAEHLHITMVAKAAGKYFSRNPKWAKAALIRVSNSKGKSAALAKQMLQTLGYEANDRQQDFNHLVEAKLENIPQWLREPKWLQKKLTIKKTALKQESQIFQEVELPTIIDSDDHYFTDGLKTHRFGIEETERPEKMVLIAPVSILNISEDAKNRFGHCYFWYTHAKQSCYEDIYKVLPEPDLKGPEIEEIMEALREGVSKHGYNIQNVIGDTPSLAFAFHYTATFDQLLEVLKKENFTIITDTYWPPRRFYHQYTKPFNRPEGDHFIEKLIDKKDYELSYGTIYKKSIQENGYTNMHSIARINDLLEVMSDEKVLDYVETLNPRAASYGTGQYLFSRFYNTAYAARATARALYFEDLKKFTEVRSTLLALPFAKQLMAKKVPDWCKKWLNEHIDYAVAGLIPVLFHGKSAEIEAAEHTIRYLAEKDREKLIDLTSKHGDAALSKVNQILSFDRFDLYPKKIPDVPSFARVENLPPLVLKNGTKLPSDCITHLLTMFVFSRHDEPYIGATKIRDFLDEKFADQFSIALYNNWKLTGFTGDWPLIAIGYLGGDEVARLITPQIRSWPGDGLHALAEKGLNALARIGTDTALMYLHGIAQKIKFKSLQEKARIKIDDIAEMRNLTAAELADRLVPDLDLDSNGTKILNFGPRHFKVIFDENLKPLIKCDENHGLKILDNLPKPNKNDDSDLAKEAVQIWKALKTDTKAIAAQQIQRLEQLMCSQRRLSKEVFEKFFVNHPLIIHLVQRLLWGVYDESNQIIECFRVAEDRSYCDKNDDSFELDENAHIGVIHRLDINDDIEAKFSEIFTDYEIMTPFDQVSRSTYVMENDFLAKKEYQFATINAKTGKVMGLIYRGWEKGPVEDAGIINEMVKNLGNQLKVTLPLDEGLWVTCMSDGPATQNLKTLYLDQGNWGDVPKVQLSELLRDLEYLRSE